MKKSLHPSLTHRPKKHLGQNFLNNHYIIEQIIDLIAPQSSEHFVEIGPGLGVLTQALCPLVERLDAIEFDRDLIPYLQQKFLGDHFYLHHQDALKCDYHALRRNSSLPLRLAGNLPYQISTPLLFHLFQYTADIEDMHFMLQKEVVERMSAQPGSKSYGRLSIMTQYFAKATPLFTVSPENFSPTPKVYSQMIRLIPYQKPPYLVKNFKFFQDIVRDAFNHRRKTLKNSLKYCWKDHIFEILKIEKNARPEELTIEHYCTLANLLYEN